MRSRCSQQQPLQQQPAPEPITQACLLGGVWAPLGRKQLRPPSQHQQLLLLCQHHHPWQQLWPSQWRAVCSSAAVCSSSRGSPPTWPGAVPPLHQPSKHVTGTPPLKAQLIRGAPEAAAAAEQSAALGEAPAALPAQESVFLRHRATFILMSLSFILLFFSTGAACELLAVLPLFEASTTSQSGGCSPCCQSAHGNTRLVPVCALRCRPSPHLGW